MARKNVVDNYCVEININNVSYFEAEQIYQQAVKDIDLSSTKDIRVIVHDSIGGSHMIGEQIGCAPNGTVCRECLTMNCFYCNKYKNMENDNGESNAE